MTGNAYDVVVARLEARGSRRSGRDWSCPGPLHANGDRRPGLGVTRGDDRVLLSCAAGCAVEDVVAALGLRMVDLFDDAAPTTGRPNVSAVYPYMDENRNLLFEVVRFSPKGFRQRRPDGRGGDIWNLNGTRRVPYHLPELMKAVGRGTEVVYLVEGEKDVHAIERAGGVATCNPGGAGKWRDEYAQFLAGAHVFVVADRDEPGMKHARQVAASLEGIAKSITIVEPAAGKDAADHLAAGLGLEDFTYLDARPDEKQPSGGTVKAADVHPVAVEWLWPDRIPLGMVTVFTGFPGAGKSTILYDIAARTSLEGKAVLVATAEDHLAAVVRPRLEAAGADLDLVHIVTDPITLPDDVGKLAGWISEFGVAMFMLDPLVAFIGEGVNTHRDHHVRRVLAPVGDVAEATGAAAIVVVHTNKGMGADPLLRVSGSIGFTGAARSVVIAADDPQDDGRRIFAVVKSNLAEMPPALAYRIVGVELAGEVRTSRVDWLGEAPEIDVRELLSSRDPDERSQREDALELLRDAGVTEKAVPVRDLLKEADAVGIHEKSMQRARRNLGVAAWRDGFGGPWMWGPKPGHEPDTRSGHLHPVQNVQNGADLREQPPDNPIVDTASGLGEPSSPEDPEPGWRQIQRDAGEVPETDERKALELVKVMLDATETTPESAP